MSYEEKNDQVANRLKATNSTNSAGKIVINNAPATNEVDKSKNLGIVISNATAKWTDTQTEHTLSNINLIGRPGRLIAVIGPIGAGKVLTPIPKLNIIHIRMCRKLIIV